MSKQSEKLKAYRQACFVVTDMDRDDPEDVVRAWEAMQARVEMLQAEVKTWMDREAEKNRKLGACMIELQAYHAWAEKIDRWHTELCGMVGVPPVHPANARLDRPETAGRKDCHE